LLSTVRTIVHFLDLARPLGIEDVLGSTTHQVPKKAADVAIPCRGVPLFSRWHIIDPSLEIKLPEVRSVKMRLGFRLSFPVHPVCIVKGITLTDRHDFPFSMVYLSHRALRGKNPVADESAQEHHNTGGSFMPRVSKAESTETEIEAAPVEETPTESPSMYDRLCAEFDQTFERTIPGGRSLTYITGEQVVSRLNEVIGFMNWDWEVVDSGINEKEDEVWVQGVLTIVEDMGRRTRKNGFGGAKIKRTKGDGRTISLGNDMKAAETDAFKKAAAKCGVGLYLYQRSGEGEAELPTYTPSNTGTVSAPNVNSLPRTSFPTGNSDNSTTGVIQAVSMPGIRPNGQPSLGGIKVNDQWYNVSNRVPLNLDKSMAGQIVTIQHAPGKTFIDGLAFGQPTASAPEAEPEMAF
jgi:hypothetical protein